MDCALGKRVKNKEMKMADVVKPLLYEFYSEKLNFINHSDKLKA